MGQLSANPQNVKVDERDELAGAPCTERLWLLEPEARSRNQRAPLPR